MARAKTPSSLQDLSYTEPFEGFGDSVAPRYGGPSAKYTYLEDGKRFLKVVAAELPTLTFKIKSNPAGVESAGDLSMTAWSGARVVYCALIYRRDLGYAHFMWRIGLLSYAMDGANQWLEDPNTTPAMIADQIRLLSYAPQREDRSP